jgi:hypothetical protein
MVLRLLPRTPPGPDPLQPSCSRFGDWREPFTIASDVDVDPFVAAARGLPIDVHIAATVAIEARLLAETVAMAGIDAAEALTTLDAAASAAESLAALEGTRYRQALIGGAGFAVASSLNGSVLLPTRLHRRAAAADFARALTEERLQQGVRWELAALGEGRFIEDWGLAVLARVAR